MRIILNSIFDRIINTINNNYSMQLYFQIHTINNYIIFGNYII